jgi:glycolate oxidase iron-sulfur subunit
MRTHFRAEQLAYPALADAEKNLRACVHCGICTATCPTYVLLGDERDSPRGRIVMMQQMLEAGGAPSAETVHHLDRCLSCLGCRTACPSGVDYARLIDQSRTHIERHYRRPLGERVLRWSIATVLTRPWLTHIALAFAGVAFPFTSFLPRRLRAMAEKARLLSSPVYGGGVARSATEGGTGTAGRRVALLPGCVQQTIAPEIDEAIARLLARRGIELVRLEGAGCCGALPHHLGRESEAKAWARKMIEAFDRAGGSKVFEGVFISATGCAAHIHEVEYLFADEPDWQPRARVFSSALVQLGDLISHPPLEGGSKFANTGEQISGRGDAATGTTRPSPKNPSLRSEFFDPPSRGGSSSTIRVALHVSCSQQHGLRWPDDTQRLQEAGFEALQIPEGHLCCGSAGSYSILQPEIANALRERKLANIRSVRPDVIATSNIGCLQHLSGPHAPPIMHVAELLDWAEGGPIPSALHNRVQLMAAAEPVH